jgi:hypothetical protein
MSDISKKNIRTSMFLSKRVFRTRVLLVAMRVDWRATYRSDVKDAKPAISHPVLHQAPVF